jgi:molybdenum cofactor cytidylyltransferase
LSAPVFQEKDGIPAPLYPGRSAGSVARSNFMSGRSRIVGIVLAAGQSVRMGRAKALLSYPPTGETFVSRIVTVLRDGGLDDVVVVGRPTDVALRSHLDTVIPRARYVENPHADLGQLSSLLAGIDYAEARGAEAVAVMPVDMPQVQADTVAVALRSFQASTAAVVRVSHGGRHGHPVIFRSSVFTDLRRADMSVGAKAVLREQEGRILNVEVADPGVVRDVDVPEDYRRLFRREPS